ncbi:hypothetical protein ACLB2K_056928 [Fragaria x ananassa]
MEYSPFLERSWSFQSLIDSSFDQSAEFINMDHTPIDSSDFSSLFINSNEFSEISEITSYPFANLFTAADDLIQVTSQGEEVSMDLEGCEADLMIEGFLCNSLEVSEGSFPSQKASSHQFSTEGNDVWSPDSLVTSEASSMDSTSIQSPLTFPREKERIENELSIRHLLQAFAEAIEYGQKELVEVILRCISEKASPTGEAFERLAFNLCQEVVDEQQQGGDYLKQESLKNFEAALKVFIQNFPYARFAHYVANSAILDAIPVEAETVHIVDFDMGDGIQLSQIIEALAQRFKTLKVTAIKWEEEESDCAPAHWRFEETKKQLQNHARSFGLNLKLEEVAMEDLVTEIKKAKKRGGGKEFLAFNCMNSLPHMRRRRSRRHVMEYLRLAKELLASSGNSKTTKSGIITFADGNASENLENHSSFSSFFNENLVHYQALLESMELNFPSHLAEARMVMECIFIAPFVSSQDWFQQWIEMKDFHVQPWFGLEGRRLSKENLMEAKEIVGDEGSYGIRIEGRNRNEMVLEWRGTPLMEYPSWPFHNMVNSSFDQSDLMNIVDSQIGSSDFSSLVLNSDVFSDLSETCSYPLATVFCGDDLIQVSSQLEEFPMNLEEIDHDLMIECLYGNFLENNGGTLLSQEVSTRFSIEGDCLSDSLVTCEVSSMDSTSILTSQTAPPELVDIDNESGLRHLLKAYAESMENGQKELEEVIFRCIKDKASPIGQTLDRLAFNLCREAVDDQQGDVDYLKQQSYKNFEPAFELFYQNFPYGKFAHYAANSAILEAIPEDTEMVHIVDFDMGEGLQLSQMIEALEQRLKTLKVTAIKWEDEESGCALQGTFGERKKQLQKHARSFGLNLKVEEVALEDLVAEIKKTKKRAVREFLAFNCMVSLPHMRRRRSRSLVIEFLRLAKDLLATSGNYKTGNTGIVTFGDGEACERLGNQLDFSSFFDGNLVHYQALSESIESNFPSHLAEARMVLENIFLAP